MKIDFVVLAVQQYSIKSDDGSKLEGVSCTYIQNGDLLPKVAGDTAKGYIPVKCTFPIESFSKFECVPGIYCFDVEFVSIGGVGGKGGIRPLDFEFVSSLC